ncbi:EF-hand calcium-binding domain-containing protein 14 isoform X1 [Megalops cyprinoides]|uniref:EF-hand calcium-binding domain-containing protein 14 isoform X1 n=1 Tax=Megalops cyprinoides TaxID=118141 RepID=UPI001864BFC2|nr:EF-hand calcium-binding domain-containing protein 14 isoform X1 [Megalops cyprinoides]
MKKRKELNALIGIGGDSKRKKPKKGSGHRLLRTEPPDSDTESSSDDDEFGNMSGVAAFGKRSYAQCCSICYPLCGFIILAACVMACAGLVWMQVALKEDLDSLKEKLHTMESSQKASSHEIPRLSEELKDRQRTLEDIVSGDRGLNKLWSNLTEINRKINLLDSAVSHLKANIKSASDLINLPTTVEELQKSVATIGSTLTSVQHDVKTVQADAEEQRKAVDGLRKNQDKEGKEPKSSSRTSPERSSDNCSSCAAVKQEVLYLQDSVGELNSTQVLLRSQMEERLGRLGSSLSNLTLRVSSLESGLLLLGTTPTPLLNGSAKDPRAERLREKLDLISALTSTSDSPGLPEPQGLTPDQQQPASDPAAKAQDSGLSADSTKVTGVQHFKDSLESSAGGTESLGGAVSGGDSTVGNPPAPETDLSNPSSDPAREGSAASKPTRRPAFLSQSVSKKELRTGGPAAVSFPGIRSIKDLEEFFQGLKEAPTQGLSYEELRRMFGAGTPDSRALEMYDKDGDKKYSWAELRAAVGV